MEWQPRAGTPTEELERWNNLNEQVLSGLLHRRIVRGGGSLGRAFSSGLSTADDAVLTPEMSLPMAHSPSRTEREVTVGPPSLSFHLTASHSNPFLLHDRRTVNSISNCKSQGQWRCNYQALQ